MNTEQIKFYILRSLMDVLEDAKRDKILSTLSNPHNSVPHMNIIFRLVGKGIKITFEDVTLALPAVVKAGFVKEVFWNNEKQYTITFEGREEYERLLNKYPQSAIEKVRKAVKTLPESTLNKGEMVNVSVATPGKTKQTKKKIIPAVFPSVNGKIFLSHANKDKFIIQSFQDNILVTALGLSPKQIFNISVDASGIKSGQDFRRVVRSELQKARAVILFISENYKLSEACLNEMGAAWMLPDEVPVIPFIVAPVEFESAGFIHKVSQLLKLNDAKDLKRFVSQYKGELFTSNYDDGDLDRKIADFLEDVSAVKVKIHKPFVIEQPVKRAVKIFDENGRTSHQLIKKYFDDETLPKKGTFYHINDHGNAFYIFENEQFHLIPNNLTAYFFGLADGIPVINIGLGEDDLDVLIGDPMPNVYELPIIRTKDDNTLWIFHEKKRRQVVGNKLVAMLKEDMIGYVENSNLLRIPLGNIFTLPGQ